MDGDEAQSWHDRFAAIALLDGDEWAAEIERVETEWKAAYDEAFVACAVRRGWRKEDAETWPSEIHDDACISAYNHNYCPVATAERDVIECEEPPAHD